MESKLTPIQKPLSWLTQMPDRLEELCRIANNGGYRERPEIAVQRAFMEIDQIVPTVILQNPSLIKEQDGSLSHNHTYAHCYSNIVVEIVMYKKRPYRLMPEIVFSVLAATPRQRTDMLFERMLSYVSPPQAIQDLLIYQIAQFRDHALNQVFQDWDLMSTDERKPRLRYLHDWKYNEPAQTA